MVIRESTGQGRWGRKKRRWAFLLMHVTPAIVCIVHQDGFTLFQMQFEPSPRSRSLLHTSNCVGEWQKTQMLRLQKGKSGPYQISGQCRTRDQSDVSRGVVEKYAQSLIELREEALTQSREIGRWGSSSRRLLGECYWTESWGIIRGALAKNVSRRKQRKQRPRRRKE